MTLLLAYLADQQPVRSHPQRLLDQAAQANLASALQGGLTGLHGHPVRQGRLQLKDFLARDNPLAGRDGCGQTIEQRRLPSLRAPRDDDIQAGHDAGLKEPGALTGQRAESNKLVEGGDGQHELADVDRPGSASHVGNHDVQPGPVREHRIDERLAQVHPAPRGLEHPLDQVGDLRLGENRRGQLAAPAARHENPAGFVYPHLLDLGVVEISLQGTEAGDRVVDMAGHGRAFPDSRERPGQGALLVVAEHLVDQTPDGCRVPDGVQSPAAHQLADVFLDQVEGIKAHRLGAKYRRRHRSPLSVRPSPALGAAESMADERPGDRGVGQSVDTGFGQPGWRPP